MISLSFFCGSPLDHEYIKFWQALHEPNQTGTFEGLLQKFDACKAWEVESMFARALLRYLVCFPSQILPKTKRDLKGRVLLT